MSNIPDDTEVRFSLLELGDVPPDVPLLAPTPAPEPEKPSLRPAPHEPHSLGCGLRVHVMMNTRRVFCGVCGELLDPIDVLRAYAKRERNFEYQNEDAKRTLASLRAEIDELRRERNNLKSQVRRGRGKRS